MTVSARRRLLLTVLIAAALAWPVMRLIEILVG